MSNEDLKKAIDLLASAKCIIDNATCDDEAFSETRLMNLEKSLKISIK